MRTNIFLILIFITSCISEDYFGLSSAANITGIEVSNQATNAKINSSDKSIIIEFPPGLNLSAIQLRSISLSSFATSDKKPGDVLDFTTAVPISVTAEDGSTLIWELIAEVASSSPQLANSDFNNWYQTSAGYYEPGESAQSTIWGTGNPGTVLLGLFATTPVELSAENFAVQMETLDNGRLPASFGFPISAATIYTGVFNSDNLDPTDPQAAIDFGTPFIGRPISFSIEYSYVPGPQNKDKNGNILSYPDQCDIYVLLEVRSGGQDRRLATAWFRSDEQRADLSNLEVPFVYGELDDSFPSYMKPANGLYISNDSSEFILPTHLTFVATSSYDGANFSGAVGSKLIIDNLVMQYE